MTPPSDRLDSWKAISEHLGRDVRTLQRWETQGLPVYRVAGGKRGQSVFAYKSEIDVWMRTGGVTASETRPTAPPPAPADVVTPPRRAPWRLILAAGLVAFVFVAWRSSAASVSGPIRVTERTDGVVATDGTGRERWRFTFPTDETTALPDVPPVVLTDGPSPAALATTALSFHPATGVSTSGLLRWFSLNDGALLRTFSFTDRMSFAGHAFGEPWVLSDVRSRSGSAPLRIAVAGRHNTWWPSLVTILDEHFDRHGTFVNRGWVLAVRWLDAHRIAIAGFNESRNGGMLAVLDADHLDGTSPELSGATTTCEGCPAGRPLFYAVFPRSELNTITASRFNGAGLDVHPDGSLSVRTKELERETEAGPVAEALYEFSSTLELTSASYGAAYWDRHTSLEIAGRVTHPREQCPERSGPPSIYVWTPATAWRAMHAPR